MPDIDELNSIFERDAFSYAACPIRFSIGAILFTRKNYIDMGMFKVEKNTTAMGADEVQLCNYCMCKSKPIIVLENTVVGHLSFGTQNEFMKQYYLDNKYVFDLKM